MKDLLRVSAPLLRPAVLFVSALVLLLSFFELIPLFAAFTAGIAGLSIIIFGPLIILSSALAIACWYQKRPRSMGLAIIAAVVSLLALIQPTIGFISLSRQENTSLHLDLKTYSTFSGDSIAPARTLVYKTADREKLRLALYQTDTKKVRPTVLLVHGGGWQYGNYLRTNNWPKLLKGAGYQVISIEYRLATKDTPTWDKAPKDISDAVTYVKEHAPELGVDTTRIAIAGQSAGGHLALLEAHKSHTVRVSIGLYAPTDLTDDYNLSVDKDSETAFLGGSPTDQPARYKSVSVENAVSAASPPTLLIQGTSDDIVSETSSVKLSRRLGSFGIEQRLVLLPYTGHSFDNQVGGFATQIAEQVTLDFLSKTLR